MPARKSQKEREPSKAWYDPAYHEKWARWFLGHALWHMQEAAKLRGVELCPVDPHSLAPYTSAHSSADMAEPPMT